MKIEKIYTGSWFPRTKLHLKEFFNFLKYESSELELDKKKIASLHDLLKIKKVDYTGGTFDQVSVLCEDCDFEYFGDGLLVLGKDFENIKKDLSFLENFYQKKLAEILSFIYSKGAPLPLLTMLAPIHRVRTTLIAMSQATEEEVNDLLKSLGSESPHAKVIDKNYQIYFSPQYICIVSKKVKTEECMNLIRHYIFFREYEAQMHKFLNINRYLWDNVADILKKEVIKYKELPRLREKLLDYKEKNTLIKNRINQMDDYISTRQIEATNSGYLGFLNKYKADRFAKTMGIHNYVFKLWQMTDESLSSAAELISSLYQENTQKELTTLQAIFLIGTTASFLTLGTMPGAVLKFFNPDGDLIAGGQFLSFDLMTMLKFGFMALMISLGVYILWEIFFKNVRKFKVISIIKGLKNKDRF
ncbi:hypothetical protein KKD80_01810 [Patescibacteria group bacterium]|nr:hypothetical protein [Patescibacteria group bacterium]